MKICLITAFPPSRGGLAEYGLHLAEELERNPYLSLSILADQLPQPMPETNGFAVHRCWSFNDPRSVSRLLGVIRDLDPDVVWFNLLLSTFGHNPLAAFSGLTVPLWTRLGGRYTHVTLHHLMDTIDLGDAGVRYRALYRAAGAFATRMLLLSNSVSVLLPAYRTILRERHGGRNVHFRPHGILALRPELPDFTRRNNPHCRILAFGKWGTYKRLESMIEAFALIRERVPEARLIIAGGDHPHTPGYVASIAARHRGDPGIEFTGYVPEGQVADLFRSASVAVLPYSSSAGASGVVHLAVSYGVPVVCADLPDFRQMADAEGLAIEFCRKGDTEDLAEKLIRLLEDPEEQRLMAERNFVAALRMTMPEVIAGYLRHFDRAQQALRLKPVSRLRRVPRWVPFRALLRRAIVNGSGWNYRPALPPRMALLDGDGEISAALDRTGLSMDRDPISAVGSPLRVDPAPAPRLHAPAPAGSEQQSQSDNGRHAESDPTAPPSGPSGNHRSGQPHAQPERTLPGTPLRGNSVPRQESRRNGNGNGRVHAADPGHDAAGTDHAAHSGGEAAGECDGVVDSAGKRTNCNLRFP